MQVSPQQQSITVVVTQEDHDTGAAFRKLDGTCDTTRDPIARAVCRKFEIPLGSVSVGIDRIDVFDGDAAEDRLVATYRMDSAGQEFVALFDVAKRIPLPFAFKATLEEVERKKAKGDYGSYDVYEYAEPAREPEPVIVGAVYDDAA